MPPAESPLDAHQQHAADDYCYARPLRRRQPFVEEEPDEKDAHRTIERGQRRRDCGVGLADIQVQGEQGERIEEGRRSYIYLRSSASTIHCLAG